MTYKKKLIEVALPLETINKASAREKSIRHGHPSTLHLWWARRPLAAARAVIFTQMVDDPSAVPEEFPTPEAQERERRRLFRIIEDLVQWENTTNEEVLERARAEIRRSWARQCLGAAQAATLSDTEIRTMLDAGKIPALPAFHDPFAGGGSLPLEAQRLGLEAYASDLNPVAVLINKAMIEIPPKFAGKPPVHPPSPGGRGAGGEGELFARAWRGAQGLAEDVRYYGQWMRDEAEKRIGHLYPKIEVTPEMAAGCAGLWPARPDLKPYVGRKLTVIAWLWARTVKSPNPAFAHVDVPLASTFMLSTKPGKEAYVEPVILGASLGASLGARASGPQDADETSAHPGYRFTVRVGKPKDAEAAENGTKLARGANFRCLMSGTPITGDYIKAEGKAGRMGARLMAIVAEGDHGRVYLAPIPEHEAAAREAKPEWRPEGEIPKRMTGGNCTPYGLTSWRDLFTPRQLVALTTFSDLVGEAIERVKADYLGARAGCAGLRPALGWHSRGYHPHFDQPGLVQSITFRLHDSVPASLLQQWREELGILNTSPADDDQLAKLRERIDKYEDAGHGACYLRQPEIATIVEQALCRFDGERYRLLEWCIMPNHVHVLIETLGARASGPHLSGHTLADIVRSWKTFTAREANRLLAREGAFWMADYYDRFIRDERHLAAVRRYIRENPVKAGLCAKAEEWRFGSASREVRAVEGEERAGGPRTQDDVPLRDGGTGATAYAEAVGVYLGIALSRLTDICNALCRWEVTKTQVRNLFGRQAIPMLWDFAENNVFGEAAGDYMVSLGNMVKALEQVPSHQLGFARQDDAQSQFVSTDKLVSTDPPYYDNIGYADLSDFFYVWLRRSLKPVFPDLFATLAVPKAGELVATPYRHGSKEKAESFFLDGMTQAMHRLAEQAHPAFPVTIYYAFKQAETLGAQAGARASGPHDADADETSAHPGVASTGWETFLDAVIRAGFAISGTWPMRTELSNRMIGSGTNALASSIVLVCRPRAADAPTATRREFVAALKAELPQALRHLQGLGTRASGPHAAGTAALPGIAPVDLAQAAIGPGMAVYTRYAKVLDAEGRALTVREALSLINQTLDEALAEQEGDFDADSRWALAWFEQCGFSPGEYGVAETLSKAKNTSVAGMVEAGIVESKRGKVRLLRPDELPADWPACRAGRGAGRDPATDPRLTVWEVVHHLVRALASGGESAAAALVAQLGARAEIARELAYRLYTLCERKKRAAEALAYNGLVQSWPEIVRLAREGSTASTEQSALFGETRE